MLQFKRRDFLRVLGASATASLLHSPAASWARSPQPAKRNVLFFAVDDLKPILGCYGDQRIKTPNIDRLAERGMTFLNNHCQQAVCGPSRASLLTGMRPDQTKVWDLKTLIRDINPDVVTLPQHFKQNGYESVGMGKIFDPRSVQGVALDDPASWSGPYPHPKSNPDSVHGFCEPSTVKRLREKMQDAREKGVKGYHKIMRHIGGIPTTECYDTSDDAYADGRIANMAVDKLKQFATSDKPFFLAVGFKKPHLPFVAPKKYWDLYKRQDMQLADWQKMPLNAPEIGFQDSWELKAVYDVPKTQLMPEDLQREMIHGYHACVSYIDAQVGKVLDALDASGKADNTMIVLWGDHGWHLGDHGMWCKHTNFEQATRSPMIISAPWLKAKGQSTTMPTEFVDIYPTLCDLAGLEKPTHLAGTSLLPVLNDASKHIKDAAVSQFPRHTEDRQPAMGYAIRNERYRYIEWVQKDFRKRDAPGPVIARELYDYEVDPHETRSFLDDPKYADVLRQMQALARKHWPITQ
ncbi:MAG: sulfatase [Phycisphaeraceae bacterium]|nr:sulfatase [Phycisphaeraceae bacterium]